MATSSIISCGNVMFTSNIAASQIRSWINALRGAAVLAALPATLPPAPLLWIIPISTSVEVGGIVEQYDGGSSSEFWLEEVERKPVVVVVVGSRREGSVPWEAQDLRSMSSPRR